MKSLARALRFWCSTILSEGPARRTGVIDKENDAYMAYMLRLWQAGENGQSTWRASVESPHTGEHQIFADLEALFAFLEERTRGGPGVDQQIETD
jgi:hypothetical protein